MARLRTPVSNAPEKQNVTVAANRLDLVLLVAINFMWALKWTLAKVALRELQPVSITLFPMIGCIALMIPFLYRTGRDGKAYFGIVPKEVLRPGNILRFIALGAIGQVGSQVVTTWGLKYMPATDAAFIGLTTPILNALLAIFIVGESLSWRLLPGFTLAIAGVLMITGLDLHSGMILHWSYLFGAVLLCMAHLGAAFYNAYSKRLLNTFHPIEVLFYSYVAVVICLLPFHVLLEQPLSLQQIAAWHLQTWLSLALLAIFVYGLSMILFLEVLTRRPLAPVSISIYLMPVFGALISTTTLREPVTSGMIVGGTVVLCSTLFVNAGKPKAS